MRKQNVSPFILTSVMASAFSCAWCQTAEKNEKPNIVIILADDLGWGDVGFHGSKIMTPNLDKLAEQGIQMNRFYTAPVSSPTRAGLMTGRYPNRFGIRETVIPPWRDFGLDPTEEILPEMLAKAGYSHRAIIGKWHLGHSRREYYPLSNGFTHFYGHLNGAIDYFTHQREGQLDWHNDWESSYDEGYATDLLTDEAVKCINEYSKDAPFFLYVAYNAPHTPLQAKAEDIALYTDDIESLTPKQKKVATFSAMVTCIDRGIGRIHEALRQNGIEENTLFIFFSDNGADPNSGGTNQPLRGSKFDEWDGGVRVPALVFYPAKLKGNREVNQVVGFVDIMPTIRSMVGIKEAPARAFDGINILSVWSGEADKLERDFYLGCGAVVNNDFKFVLPGKNDRMKIDTDFLSHYPDDPYEKNNVAEKFPREAARLKQIADLYDTIEPPFKVLPYGEGREGFVAPFEWKVTQ